MLQKECQDRAKEAGTDLQELFFQRRLESIFSVIPRLTWNPVGNTSIKVEILDSYA